MAAPGRAAAALGADGDARRDRSDGIGAGWLHGGHLRRAGDARAPADRRRPDGRPAHHHHRGGELSRLRRGDPGAVVGGANARPGASHGHDVRGGPGHRRGPVAPAVPPGGGDRPDLHLRRPDHRHGRPGQMARPGVGAEVPGLRRLGLRHLRRLLLPRQGGRGGRRRQHRGRGGALPHQLRLQGHTCPPSRRAAGREGHADAPAAAPQDRDGLERGPARGAGRGRAARRHRRGAARSSDRRDRPAARARRFRRYRPCAGD